MDYFLKIFELLTNFTAAKSSTMSKQVVTTLRKIIAFVIIALGSMALFCVGVTMAVSELASQIDNNQSVDWNGKLTSGVILAVITLGTFLYFLSQKAWLKAASLREEEKKSGPSPMEEALSILIKDIVVERQMKREQEIQNPPTI